MNKYDGMSMFHAFSLGNINSLWLEKYDGGSKYYVPNEVRAFCQTISMD